jgi:serine/threonine protein kinase
MGEALDRWEGERSSPSPPGISSDADSPGTRLPPWDDARIRPSFDGFEIEGLLAVGAVGAIYRARQRSMPHRAVAIKVVKAGLESDTSSLLLGREIEALGRLRHPHIVQVLGSGVVGATRYLAMELIDGTRLCDWIPRPGEPADPARTPEILRLCAQLARALDHAHSKGVVHRDMQPGNVLIRANGEAVLIDFGFARMNDGRDVSLPVEAAGSLSHLAPEVRAGEAVGPAADVYGLCAILMHLLTGRPPVMPRDRGDLRTQAKHADPVKTVMACKQLSSGVRKILARGLARLPRHRYANAAVLALELDALVDGKPPRTAWVPSWRDAARWLHRLSTRWFTLSLAWIARWSKARSRRPIDGPDHSPRHRTSGIDPG